MSDRLATARWEEQSAVSQKYPFTEGKFWLGRAEDASAIGYRDDRHICLVSGTRAGKGASIIINNLCFWPGSAVIVDPKGENATVTAARRAEGSEHCAGMYQRVHVLDPFKIAHVDDAYRSCFNPLADLDPQRDETIDEASRLANAIVVVKDDSHEPFWDESARAMVRGLILHVLTGTEFTDSERNLITVRNLITRGEWRVAEAMRDRGYSEETIDPPHLLLWRAMEVNPAFDGIVAGIGSRFRSMMMSSAKTFEGVLQATALNTEFLDSPGMRRILAKSDFKLSELKTSPEGMTLYLSLPQRYMDTHYRWLRMMVALTTTEMEITSGRPANGHPVLMVLDEFAGLKRMTAIENAVAQLAGFGVKLLFVLQSLEQLKHTYKDNWETFLANAGVKVFFSIEDHFTREYVSKLVGETEMIREVQSSNESLAENESYAEGVSQSFTEGTSSSETVGTSRSTNQSQTEGVNQSFSASQSQSSIARIKLHKELRGKPIDPAAVTIGSPKRGGRGTWGISQSTSEGTSSSITAGITDGTSHSDTHGTSDSRTDGTSQTRTTGKSRTAGTGRSETVHRRPLLQPDEVGRLFGRVDDTNDPDYPGLALVTITGADPLFVRRSHYFEDVQFIDCFSPHPDHPFRAAIAKAVSGIRPLIDKLEATMSGRRLTVAKWLVEPGKLTVPGQPGLVIERVPPDNRTIHIPVPYSGKVTQTAAQVENLLPSGDWLISDGALFTVKNYGEQNSDIDPFQELREACIALGRLKKEKLLPEKQKVSPEPKPPTVQSGLDQLTPELKAALKRFFLYASVGLLLFALLGSIFLPEIVWFGIAIYVAVALFFPLLLQDENVRNEWNRHSQVRCPSCKALQPPIRIPSSRQQFLWGGWTCKSCSTEMDKWGNQIEEEPQLKRSVAPHRSFITFEDIKAWVAITALVVACSFIIWLVAKAVDAN